MKRFLKNKKGVTLAELLAVVTIMGIIAAIAVPLVGNTIDNARKDAFLGDGIAIQSALRTYCLTANEGDTACKESSDVAVNNGVNLKTNDVLDTLISKSFSGYNTALVFYDSTTKDIHVKLDNGTYSFGDDDPSTANRSSVTKS
ncbi:type II secretion system protein [Mycoplasmatota bacterium WC44]